MIVKKIDKLSVKSKYSFIANFFNDLDKLNKPKTQKEKIEKKREICIIHTASDLHNDLLGIYFDEYNELPDAKRNKMKHKYYPTKLSLEKYNYDNWF